MELARDGARVRGDRGALRRQPLPPGPAAALGPGGRGGADVPGRVGEVPRGGRAVGLPTRRLDRPDDAAHARLDRVAAVAGVLRVGRRGGRTGGVGRRAAPGVDLGWHRPVRLLRRRRPDPPGARRGDPGPGARHGRRRVVRRRDPAGGGCPGGAGLHAAVPVDADRVLGRRPAGRGGSEVPRRVLRTHPRRVGPGRLRDLDRARRHGDPRSLGHHAEPRRGAHRHRRDLPPGRPGARGAGVAGVRPAGRQRRADRAARAAGRGRAARRRPGGDDPFAGP